MFVVAGEALIDLIERPDGGAGDPVYDGCPGGGPFNSAIALARLGSETGYLFPLSSDMPGERLADRLEQASVGLLHPRRPDAPTPLALVSVTRDGQPGYRFYRAGTADRDLDADELIAALPARISVFHTGTLAISEDPDAAILERVIAAARERGALISVDPNMRPAGNRDLAGYAARVKRVLGHADILKASDEDLAVLFPGLDPAAAIERAMKEFGVALAVATMGARGARALSGRGEAESPARRPSRVVDTVGAGDCFQAGLLAWLVDNGADSVDGLADLDAAALTAALRQAVVTAGLNCAAKGCVPPTRDEVDVALSAWTD